MVETCPHCGSVIPLPIEGIHFTKSERKIYEYVAKHPRCETTDIISRLYGHREDGGPEGPRTAVHVFINRINKKLTDHKIKSSARGPGATYRLVEIKAESNASV